MRFGNFYSNNYIEYESNVDRNKTLSNDKYLNKTILYLKDIITNLRKFGTWKIQLTIAINSMSSKDTDGKRLMYSKSDNI